MEMIIGILGLIATIIFGVLSIDLFKRKRRPCKLTYYPSETINIYRNLTKGFDCIEVLKNDKPIKNNVIFLSGIISCNGDVDLTGSDNVVHMCLPEGYKWLDVKIDSCSEGVEAQFSITKENNRNASLCFGLFRVNEFIKLQALVEYEEEKKLSSLNDLHRKITFSHRIQNTSDVEKGDYIRSYIPMKRVYLFTIVNILVISMVIWGLMQLGDSDNVIYKNCETGKEYSCMVSDDNMIELHSRSIKEMLFELRPEKIAIDDFKKQYVPVFQYKQMNLLSMSFLLGFIIPIVIGVLPTIIYVYFKVRRINKYYLLYKSSDKENANLS
jgi:ABC-type lipoprotein release transport system permease subunit